MYQFAPFLMLLVRVKHHHNSQKIVSFSYISNLMALIKKTLKPCDQGKANYHVNKNKHNNTAKTKQRCSSPQTTQESMYIQKACNCIKKETLAQVLSGQFCEISKNPFFTEHLWTTASVNIIKIQLTFKGRIFCIVIIFYRIISSSYFHFQLQRTTLIEVLAILKLRCFKTKILV